MEKMPLDRRVALMIGHNWPQCTTLVWLVKSLFLKVGHLPTDKTDETPVLAVLSVQGNVFLKMTESLQT